MFEGEGEGEFLRVEVEEVAISSIFDLFSRMPRSKRIRVKTDVNTMTEMNDLSPHPSY